MVWQEQEQLKYYTKDSLEGFFCLHGDVMAKQYRQERLKGKSYPTIAFPSGVICEITTPRTDNPKIHLFGKVELPVNVSREMLISHVVVASIDDPNLVYQPVNESTIAVGNRVSKRGYRITLREDHITDISLYPYGVMELLPGHLRAVLPPIRTTDGKGWQAVAPLKIFTPDGNWTWYPTEFDGEDTFFGLVIGFEAELGYFSLNELESVRGLFGLPLERDLHYTPITLERALTSHLD